MLNQARLKYLQARIDWCNSEPEQEDIDAVIERRREMGCSITKAQAIRLVKITKDIDRDIFTMWYNQELANTD